ncbi:MAG: hypothetical protein APZ16_04550 [Candidatus Hadarchaeum yellowstonense]|uniref:Uncharacterized protein n=1 Tax=Hadarchaeum yellowstonense TaxID=1776334 RepID=A0A147JVY2_HADYE|nr:MAG: hypothetical protein APZ16_04550 [Candidatus Hadarchaeum yellowstonense]
MEMEKILVKLTPKEKQDEHEVRHWYAMLEEVQDWGWKILRVDHVVQEAIVEPDDEGKSYIAKRGLPRMLCNGEIIFLGDRNEAEKTQGA